MGGLKQEPGRKALTLIVALEKRVAQLEEDYLREREAPLPTEKELNTQETTDDIERIIRKALLESGYAIGGECSNIAGQKSRKIRPYVWRDHENRISILVRE